MIRLLFILVVGLTVLGCRTQQTAGRLDEFIVTEAKSYGATGGPPQCESPLLGKWTIKRDKFGTVIDASGVGFEPLDHFFRKYYGIPHGAGKNAENKAQWVIPAKVAGVSFWYSETTGGVQITILKPDSMWHY